MDFSADLQKIKYKEFEASDYAMLSRFFCIRPNLSCDSAPLCIYLYKHYYSCDFCLLNDECVLLLFGREQGEYIGFLPYCAPEKMEYYFKLQEKYFNEVLHQPLIIYSADHEGVQLLTAANALGNYRVSEENDLKDYLYDAESMRTLAGRRFSKKRNHIHKFEENYRDRWEYRSMGPEDHSMIRTLLEEWRDRKADADMGMATGEDSQPMDPFEEMDGELLGIDDIASHAELFGQIQAGGIFIDGELKAFSMGSYNPEAKMAVINIEKADSEIQGLYQVINQQFLLHEYPDAQLVNREDDIGLEGLRKSKLSYYPIDFELKYKIEQKDFAG